MKNTPQKKTLSGKTKGFAALGLGLAALTLAPLAASPALAHGANQNPMSRQLGCYLDGAGEGKAKNFESCNDAYKLSGSNQFYNWQGIVNGDTRQGQADPQWQKSFPDGKLCSAGNPEYAGLDLPGDDWPTTDLVSGADTELSFRNTVAHNPYTFSYFITKDGYDPSKALTWADLEPTPFLVADSLSHLGSGSQMETKLPTVLPEKTGNHVVYSIWQGNIKADGSVQSNEAFVSCANVNFTEAAR